MRHFEFVGEDSSRKSNQAAKFWEVSRDGATLTIRFGPIGANGQTTIKEFASADLAKKAEEKAAAEKVKKGYVEKPASRKKLATPRASTKTNARSVSEPHGASSDVVATTFGPTPFDTQCEILSDLWLNYRDDEDVASLVAYFDMGFHLAFAHNQGIAKLEIIGMGMVEDCWNGVLEAFGIEEDLGFENLQDIIGVVPQ